MHYRRFGKTGLRMPVFSCGGMRYQHKWDDVLPADIPAANQDNLEAVIYRALELGINHFETARGYGSSEMQLGRVLPTLPRERILVQTKVAPMADAAEFLKTFDRSMGYLNLDYVDLLSLHGINNRQLLDWSLGKNGCLAAARKLQREGRARYIGFSTHATTDIILDALRSDGFDYINLHWYFVNDLNWPAVEEAARRDMGVFIISPNDKGGKLYAPPEKLRNLCAPLSPMQFNDLYCLARPQVHTLSLGAAQPSDFDEHIAALDHYQQLEQTIRPIEHRLQAEMERVLGRDWCLGWTEGLPQYVDVPGQVHLLEILRLWTFVKPFDLLAWGRMRYNLMGQGDHWFPGQVADSVDKLNLSEALGSSPFCRQIPEILLECHKMLADAPRKRLSQGG